ncbi:hypothetical protein NEILACOT_04580 [Neisseria lactamica ATCC 23970]|uniref:Uncharacterized protein n=1 Tax=Neisseria lactamica ATCC 23970 TaxID=546265 RepID=D0WAK9_NEILA|nr:hypothetical protein NEILACOT_04580 [Neisseria lactamica ATCC 23970]
MFRVWKNADYSGKRAALIFCFEEARRRQGGVFTVCLYKISNRCAGFSICPRPMQPCPQASAAVSDFSGNVRTRYI